MNNSLTRLTALASLGLSLVLFPAENLLAQDSPPGEDPAGNSALEQKSPRGSTPKEITISGVNVTDGGNYEIHTHGGDPANVGAVYLKVEVDDESHLVVVKEITLLDRHCREDEWSRKTPLEPVELHFEPDSGERVESKDASPIEITGSGRLYATFAAQQVYNACDAFGFAVTVEIDGEEGTLEVPLSVMREEPAPAVP